MRRSAGAGDQGGTYNGNPLMTAVGVAVIKTLTAPGFLEACARGDTSNNACSS